MAPEHHIVINASQASTSHTIRWYPFLKLHEERNIPEVQRELAPGYLRLYSHSGAEVRFSYARRDYQRTNLPPPLFITQNVPAVESGEAALQDAYELERQAWLRGSSFPLQEMQKTGYQAAEAAALGTKDVDAEHEPLEDESLIHTLAEVLQDEESRLRVSATALEHFHLCPFRFLWERLLHLGELEYEPPMIDPIDLGVLLHRGLELFFSRVRAESTEPFGPLSTGRRAEYREHLKDLVSEICRDHHRRNPALLPPIASEIQRRVEELLLAFLDVELEMTGEERLEGFEVRLIVPAPDIDAVLVGTVDRIDRNPNGYTLIDYKKKTVPTRGELFSREAVSLQMPFYIHLMELTGRSVTRAAYYSFENRRFYYLFGGPRTNMASEEEVHRVAAEVPRRIVEMRERISAGDFRIDASASTGCSRCSLRGVCRSGYSLGG
jgi:RecB family exonuclease